MNYPDFGDFDLLKLYLCEYAKLKCDQGASQETNIIVEQVRDYVKEAIQKLQKIEDDKELTLQEPDDLIQIKALREKINGKRKLWNTPPSDDILREKMMGALVGRMASCIMGVPVEGYTVENMEGWCQYIEKPFPPVDFWEDVEAPYIKNFYGQYRHSYKKDSMNAVPVDDDTIYTQLALLILEEYGVDFTTEDVAKAWQKYLPFACTAEEIALNNVNNGIPIEEVGITDNPYRQWIGAAIRSDGFAYACAGYPEKAAEMAFYDGFLSHRRNGIYGEMFLAAAQAAAFAVDDPIEAVKIGMTEIPRNCTLHKHLEWALSVSKDVHNYKDARKLIDERFDGMHIVHIHNNMCLIVFGLAIAQGDFLKGISEIVAMGLDNDCTAASAGSILGACYGLKAIPEHLYKRFNNTLHTYLKNVDDFHFDDMANRFIKLNKKVYEK